MATKKTEKLSKSQRQIVWEQFRKHKAALIGGVILIFMYLTAIFAGFIAPYGLNEYRKFPITQFQAPAKIHWRNPDTGRLTRPFVYISKVARDPVTRQRFYEEDPSKGMYPIKFFVHREKTE